MSGIRKSKNRDKHALRTGACDLQKALSVSLIPLSPFRSFPRPFSSLAHLYIRLQSTYFCVASEYPLCVSPAYTHAKRSWTDIRTTTKRYRPLGAAASLPAPTLNVSPPSPVHQSFSPPSPVDGYPATSDTHKPLVDDDQPRSGMNKFLWRRGSSEFGFMFERRQTLDSLPTDRARDISS